jgi:hypothetical protein
VVKPTVATTTKAMVGVIRMRLVGTISAYPGEMDTGSPKRLCAHKSSRYRHHIIGGSRPLPPISAFRRPGQGFRARAGGIMLG